jgi:hypothetical protein
VWYGVLFMARRPLETRNLDDEPHGRALHTAGAEVLSGLIR